MMPYGRHYPKAHGITKDKALAIVVCGKRKTETKRDSR